METKPCPICQRAAEKEWLTSDGGRRVILVRCGVCAEYDLSPDLDDQWKAAREANGGKLEPKDEQLLPYLSAATRQSSSPLLLAVDTWIDLARGQLNKPVSYKLRRLLEILAERSTAPGVWVHLDAKDACPLLAARDTAELEYLLGNLSERGLLRRGAAVIPGSKGAYGGVRSGIAYQLTVAGWEAVAPVSGGIHGTCFVAMSFHEDLKDAFERGIVPAVEKDCGFSVLRVDRIQHNESISERILSGIRTAQFVVADFTLQRQGVYYEAGFAQGLGRVVIWTCRDTDVKNLHFDTRQFNHVIWKNPEDLRQQLTDRIRATVTGARLDAK